MNNNENGLTDRSNLCH